MAHLLTSFRGRAEREEHVPHRDRSLISGGMGENLPSDDIADRVDGLDAGAKLLVDSYPCGADRDPEGLQTQPFRVRCSTSRNEYLLTIQGDLALSPCGPRDLAGRVRGDAVDLDSRFDRDSLRHQDPRKGVGETPSSPGSSSSIRSARVTPTPSQPRACAISTPTGPPPTIRTLAHVVQIPRVSLVRQPASRTPSIGATAGRLSDATKMKRVERRQLPSTVTS